MIDYTTLTDEELSSHYLQIYNVLSKRSRAITQEWVESDSKRIFGLKGRVLITNAKMLTKVVGIVVEPNAVKLDVSVITESSYTEESTRTLEHKGDLDYMLDKDLNQDNKITAEDFDAIAALFKQARELTQKTLNKCLTTN